MRPITFVFLAFIFVWLLQLLLSYFQMKQFNKHIFTLRRQGVKTAVGLSGNMYKRRTYAIIVVDANRQVVAAESLSGWTVFARPKPIGSVIGLHLDQLSPSGSHAGVSAKLWNAIVHAATFIRQSLEHAEEETDSTQKITQAKKKPATRVTKGGEETQVIKDGYNV